jgi:hypothetical protein
MPTVTGNFTVANGDTANATYLNLLCQSVVTVAGASSLLGNPSTSASQVWSEITLGSNLSFTGSALNVVASPTFTTLSATTLSVSGNAGVTGTITTSSGLAVAGTASFAATAAIGLAVSNVAFQALTIGGTLTGAGAAGIELQPVLTPGSSTAIPSAGLLVGSGTTWATGAGFTGLKFYQAQFNTPTLSGSGTIAECAQVLIRQSAATGGGVTVTQSYGVKQEGTDLNFWTGQHKFGATSSVANGSVTTAMSSVGPAGSHAAIQEWFTFFNSSGVQRWVPCF